MKKKMGIILALLLLMQSLPVSAADLPEQTEPAAQEAAVPEEKEERETEAEAFGDAEGKIEETDKTDETAAQAEEPSSDNVPAGPLPEEEKEEGTGDEEAGEEKAPALAAPSPKTEMKLVSGAEVDVDTPVCGYLPQDPEGYSYTDGVEVAEVHWALSCSADSYTPQTEKFEGDQVYTPWIRLETTEGYVFDRDITITFFKGGDFGPVEIKPLYVDDAGLVFAGEIVCEHDWDYDNEIRTEPTCIQDGEVTRVCLGDPSHIQHYTLKDPDAHQWGEWEMVREATKAGEGERVRICGLCGEKETEAIPRVTLPYSRVYEPETSWPMAATIAWKADQSALEIAGEEKRPATAFVWLDRELKVYDRNGKLLSDDLDAYVDATAPSVIPAFYIRDRETADNLKEWISGFGLLDCFVVSEPGSRDLVKDVADLVHVRGMLDYTGVKNPDRETLLDMAASTNGAHGKVLLLSQEAATRENVRLLQSLASTVWVQADTDLKSLVTLYTRGVNGVLVDDFGPAVSAEELFQDELPSLLRIPFVIGHRGDPSRYVENTLDSAMGAFREGADSVENDIHLSSDGVLFIYHDDIPGRLMDLEDEDEDGQSVMIEAYSFEELLKHPLVWEKIIENNEVAGEFVRYGTLYGQEEEKVYTLPTLEEYIKAFKGTGLIHDTEIKSYDPAIIPVYKEMVDSCDAWDQFFTITFNKEILDAIYRDYPEISIGALGMGTFTEVQYPEYGPILEEEGLSAALKVLLGETDRWNATFNPAQDWCPDELMSAIRHRGQTIWPWTYFLAGDFARDYLKAVTGLTTDFAWHGSDLLVEISGGDQTVLSEKQVKKPVGITRKGEEKTLEEADLVRLQDLGEGAGLMIWRFRTSIDIEGENLGEYYLYSEPFVLKITKPQGGASGKDSGKKDSSAGEKAGKEGKKTDKTRSAPATGDRSGALAWAILAFAALLGMCLAKAFRRPQV